MITLVRFRSGVMCAGKTYQHLVADDPVTVTKDAIGLVLTSGGESVFVPWCNVTELHEKPTAEEPTATKKHGKVR